MKTRWWLPEYDENGTLSAVSCNLCFHNCRLEHGAIGYCGARTFSPSGLSSPWLGKFSSQAVDPIEKKPLYHWQPGTFIFSLGSLGCNMRCPFCQNHSIAQPKQSLPLADLPPKQLLLLVKKLGLSSVAYTYNEPALQAEFILEAAPRLKENGIATVLVTNGMFSEASLEALLPWIDAANIDLKTFESKKYAALGGSLDTVKRNITKLAESGTHIELTTLVVPGVSDAPDKLAESVEWIASLSANIPLHLSRYFPSHRFKAPPTDINLLKKFADIAKTRLKHVHLGNVR